MLGAEALGHEHLDRLPEQLARGIAEQILGLGVDQEDAAVAVDDDDGVRRGLEKAAKARLAFLALGNVAQCHDHPHFGQAKGFLGLHPRSDVAVDFQDFDGLLVGRTRHAAVDRGERGRLGTCAAARRS